MASKAIHPHVTPPAATPANHPKNKGPKGDAVRYPQDHRHVVWIRPSLLVLVIVLALTSVATAWVQYLLFGLPQIPIFTQEQLKSQAAAHGFPAWLRITHYVNFLFLILLIRSGLSILVDHPRLYRNRDCTPGTEWARFTPLAVPKDRLWTAKDDARYLSPWLGLPGYRHTVGVAQHWHFLSDLFWIVNGLIYVVLLFVFSHWARLVPTSWHIFPQARATFVHYVTLHLPPEPDGFYRYNALQQLAYFVVVFVMAPLSLLTGLAMSPAIDNRFQWYARLFGGRQGARSFHFLLMAGFTAFIVVHVSLVVATGFTRNMNHIVWGVDTTGSSGLMLGAVGVAAVIGACVAAHWLSWNRPRALQVAAMRTVGALKLQIIDPLLPRAEYTKSDIWLRSIHCHPERSAPTVERRRHPAQLELFNNAVTETSQKSPFEERAKTNDSETFHVGANTVDELLSALLSRSRSSLPPVKRWRMPRLAQRSANSILRFQGSLHGLPEGRHTSPSITTQENRRRMGNNLLERPGPSRVMSTSGERHRRLRRLPASP